MGVPKRMTTVALAAAALCVAGGLTPLGQTATAADACSGGVSSDFNGDGAADTVIADPQATVDGATRAGLVRVVLGAGKGVVEVSEAAAGMGATPERGDEFGFSRAVYDVDQDGCSDLVVGAPYEDVPHDGQELIDAGGGLGHPRSSHGLRFELTSRRLHPGATGHNIDERGLRPVRVCAQGG